MATSENESRTNKQKVPAQKLAPSKSAKKNKRKAVKKPPYRPQKFQSAKELQDKVEAYFDSCLDYVRDWRGKRVKDSETGEYLKHQVRVPTITGLAVFLDTSRETLLDYENELHKNTDMPEETKHAFSDTIKKAKLRIYDETEQQLYGGKPTGAIFSLKNNYGWVDKTRVETEDVGRHNPFEGLSEDELRKLAGSTS